jgi:hypothetical protein
MNVIPTALPSNELAESLTVARTVLVGDRCERHGVILLRVEYPPTRGRTLVTFSQPACTLCCHEHVRAMPEHVRQYYLYGDRVLLNAFISATCLEQAFESIIGDMLEHAACQHDGAL